MKVNLFLPGAPKCGTTYLSGILSRSCDINVLPEKEPHYFCGWNKEYGNEKSYHDKFQDNTSSGHVPKYWADCSVTYWCDAQAAERIHRYNSTSKIILVLRDPLSQIISHYLHLRRQNFHGGDTATNSFGKAFEKYRDMLLQPLFYHREATRWKSLFGDRVKTLLFEEIVADVDFVKNLGRFLELENEIDLSESRVVDSRGGVQPKSDLHELIYRKAYKSVVKALIRPADKIVGWHNVLRVYNRLGLRKKIEAAFYNVKTQEKLEAKDEAMILDLIKDDLARVPEILGFEPDCWESFRKIKT